MRVFKLAALISTAQIALVAILFSFAFAASAPRAHASELYSQTVHDGTGENGGSFSSGFVSGEHQLVPTASGTLNSIIFWPGTGFYNCQYYDFAGGHSITFAFSSDGFTSTYTGTSTPRSDGSCVALPTSSSLSLTSGVATDVIVGAGYYSAYSFLGSVASTASGHAAKFTGGYAYSSNQSAISNYALIFYTDITPPPPGPPDTTTRIIQTAPAISSQNSTTTPSTTITFSAQYFYNASTTPYGSYDSLVMNLTRVDAASSTLYRFPGITQNALTSTSTILTLPGNSYWNLGWCFAQSQGTGLAYCTNTQDIYVQSNPLPGLFGTSTSNLTSLATTTCDILNPTGCVQNAIAFLFWPNQSVFDQFKSLQGSVRTHAPFGYVFVLIDAINGTSGSTTPTFAISIDSNIQTAYFNPLKTGIAAILWALAAFWFFKRIRDLHL